MQRTISWRHATTYTDGTLVGSAVSDMKVHVWKDGAEVYTTLPGVTEWPIEVAPGETNVWELTAELNGQISEKSPPYSYTEPFQVPMPPVISLVF